MGKTVTDAWYDTQMGLVDTTFIDDLRDPMQCDIRALPALAAERSAVAYSDGLLGEEYDREAVRRAFELNDSIGHRNAFTIFAEMVGIRITHTNIYEGIGDARKITKLDICVSTLRPRGVDAVAGGAFLTRVCRELMQWRLEIDGGAVKECPQVTIPTNLFIGTVGHSHVDAVV